MPDFITLSCPNCGAKLELTPDIDRFACANCGREHIVKRTGGIVMLEPVIDGIKRVEQGVDRTAAELAIVRINNEIVQLVTQRQKADYNDPRAKIKSYLLLIMFGVGFIILSGILILIGAKRGTLNGEGGGCAAGIFVIGLLSAIIGFAMRNEFSKKVEKWEADKKAMINYINEQLESKKSELERNKRLVS